MATNNRKNKKYGANFDSDSGDELNNGPKYHLPNRRQGAQNLQFQHNDLSDDNSSSSSSSDEEEKCEGCLEQDPSVVTCNVYLCECNHEFCDKCSNQEHCPCHPECRTGRVPSSSKVALCQCHPYNPFKSIMGLLHFEYCLISCMDHNYLYGPHLLALLCTGEPLKEPNSKGPTMDSNELADDANTEQPLC